MALFTSDTNTKKEKREHGARVTRARARALAEGREHEIIRAPWFSEKALMATERGIYAFSVPASATKADVAGAVKAVYNVEPRKVRIVNMPGKRKAMRFKRGTGVRAGRRKAYVYLRPGDSIQFA